MIDFTPTRSDAVVDEGTTRSSQPVLEADAGRQTEEPLQDSLSPAGHGTRPVALEREHVLPGPGDRFDALRDGCKVETAARLVGASRACRDDVQLGRNGREGRAGVALVTDEHSAATSVTASQQVETDLAVVPLGRGQSECPGRAVRRTESVQAHPPEEARVGEGQ